MSEQPVILWVDDDFMYIASFANMLADEGIRVISAGTLLHGKRVILSEPRLDLALLDMRVPVTSSDELPLQDLKDIELSRGGFESGYALARFIRDKRPNLPFIGISVRIDDEAAAWFAKQDALFFSKYQLSNLDFVEIIQNRMRPSIIANGSHNMPQVAVSPGTPIPGINAHVTPEMHHLQLQLRQLELEYELARGGLGKMQSTTTLAVVAGIVTVILAFAASMWGRQVFLSGWHIVALVATIAAALILFSAFVFGRAAKLKAQITKTKKELEIVAGDRVR